MSLMSPLRYRLHLAKKALFGNKEIIYEVLLCHKHKLPNTAVQVSWEKDGEYIVGKIHLGNDYIMTQGRSATEFVEMVNDAIYAAYNVPVEYTQELGGSYRITPPEQEFKRLDDVAVEKSVMNFGHVEVTA